MAVPSPSPRRALPIAFAVLLSALALACSNGSDAGDAKPPPANTPIEVKLGVVQSLSGAAAVYGPSIVNGIELAIKELEASSQAPSLRFSYEVLDDKSTPEGAREAFAAQIQDRVSAIIGPTLSNAAPEAHRLAQAASVPVLGATLTGQGITDVGDHIFRIALTEAVVVPATIEFVAGREDIRSAVLFLDSADAFSRSSADAMRAGIAAVGAAIVLEIDVAQSRDPATWAAMLDMVEFDAVLVTPLIETSLEILKMLHAEGHNELVIGANSFNTPDIAVRAGEALEGAYVGAAWNPGRDTPASRAFVEAYRSAYGRAPDLFAAQGYSAVYVLADAVRRAGSVDTAAIRSALASAPGVETPLGNLTFTPQRDARHEPVVQRITDGKLEVVR